MLFLIPAILVASSLKALSVEGFATHRPRYAHHATAFKLTATVETEDRMTSEDEEILFGGSHEPKPKLHMQHRRKDRSGNILPDPEHQLNPLDHAKDPLVNKLHTMREAIESCPDLWMELAKYCPENRALLDENLCDEKIDVTFAQMSELVKKSASVFADLGVQKGVNVAILGENSARWLMVDHGIQLSGGASAVRGADAPLDELRYIYEHSDSAGVVVLQGPRLLQKLAKDADAKRLSGALGLKNEKYGEVKTVILMHREKKTNEEIAEMASDFGVKIEVFADLLQVAPPLDISSRPKIGKDDVATIVYTSGTTGRPKGVMLSHGNLIHQTGHRLAPTKPFEETEPLPGETMLALLPVWHITERSFELWMASHGCSVVYSSIRTFKNDLAKHRPQWLVLVPRVLEKVANGVQDKFASGSAVVRTLAKFFTAVGSTTAKHKKIKKGLVVGDKAPGVIEKFVSSLVVTALSPLHAVGNRLVWSKIKDGFGGRLKVIISGGSALAGSLESFYETAGIPICVGYGLTECSPIISYRHSDTNLVTAGCAGTPCADTDVRVVDPDSKAETSSRPALPIGEVGVVIANGPQVMKGYYKNKEATAKAIDEWGWFDTGDLGRINPVTSDLILTGRAKDTIVLSNGENIEPVPIEDAILESPYADQVMLVGQDGRRLVAITVLNPVELGVNGFLDEKEAAALEKADEKVNDPKCTEEDFEKNAKILNKAAEKLRTNKELQKTLEAEVQRTTKSFRKWEQVKDVHLTLEPFAMVNGQLTQSYKVKRDSVLKRYADLLPK